MNRRTPSQEFSSLLDELISSSDPIFDAPETRATDKVDPVEKGFREILDFRTTKGRVPNGSSDNQYEAGLADRLEAYRSSERWRSLLLPLDTFGMLSAQQAAAPTTLDELIASGDDLINDPASGIFDLKHVSSAADRTTARISSPDYKAQRRPCPDFDRFRPVIRSIVEDIRSGRRKTKTTNGGGGGDIKRGDVYVLNGQIAYVAEVGEWRRTEFGQIDARTRIVFDNATETDYLARSFARALNEDPNGRVVETVGEDENGLLAKLPNKPQGHVYAARTLSKDPALVELAPLMLKIGSTINDPSKRLHGSERDPTFLLAPATLEAEWEVHDMKASDVEKALHAFLHPANVAIKMPDRFGHAVDAREWFVVSVAIVRQAIGLLRERRLQNFRYDIEKCKIVEV
jgi:hypothetical protein